MHTCEVIVAEYENLCGKPATRSVLRHCKASGEPCKPYLIWLCDEHYEHAVANWSRCEF